MASSALRIESRLALNDGTNIPRLGLGVFQSRGAAAKQAVLAALAGGYRHVDTATLYGNEREVGEAVRESGLDRSALWITSKIWDSDHGYERALQSIKGSLQTSGLDYFDLMLIHSPQPGKHKRLETYRALMEAKDKGLVRSIGVSNYGVQHIQELLSANPKYPPSVNQIEISPFFQRQAICEACTKLGIVLEAYSPLGKGLHIENPDLKKVADKYSKTTAQILIRWSLQKDFVVLPKSQNPDRIKANANVFDFEITNEDLATLDALESGRGVTWDPTRAA